MKLIKTWKAPIEVMNEASGKYSNQHWRIKHKRHKNQGLLVKSYLSAISQFQGKPITIKLIRISPRMMDTGDNLPYSFKWIRDAIADLLVPGLQAGRADDSKLITWSYDQEKGVPREKSMKVEVYFDEQLEKTIQS